MKVFTGEVVSKKMPKTAIVEVRSYRVHPLYKKRLLKIKRYHVHDELDTEVGDKVKFVLCRPYSKLKKWKMVEVVKNG